MKGTRSNNCECNFKDPQRKIWVCAPENKIHEELVLF